jgi:hypothetical protein
MPQYEFVEWELPHTASFVSREAWLKTDQENTVRSESRCALWLRGVDLVEWIVVAGGVCCSFVVFSC